MTMRDASGAGFALCAGALWLAACTSDAPAEDAGTAAPNGHRDAGRDEGDDASNAMGNDAGTVACLDAASTAPKDVFCIGLYVGRDPAQRSASAMPYAPGVPFWSDGADKQRYLYLPPGTQIDSSEMDAWKFPVGTKAFKEFRFDGRLVETRLVWKQAESNWVYATYVWDSTETHAPLNESRVPVLLASGYEIPTARDCGKCHHGGADKLLGVEAVELALPSAQGLTLAALVAAGLLSVPPPSTNVVLPEDGTGKAAAALGYLHANCGMPCHSSRGLGDETRLLLRLRAGDFWPGVGGDDDAGSGDGPAQVSETDAYRASVDQMPTTASVAQRFPDTPRISPGAHERSLLWLLSHRRGMYQMPPLVSHRIDEAGTLQLAEWIDALPH